MLKSSSLKENKLIGFVGIGEMGRPLARNVLKAGFRVVAYDIRREAVGAIEKEGAMNASSVAELAKSADVIITMLPRSSAVKEVVLRMLTVLGEGKTVIEMSTIDPRTTMTLAKKVRSTGATLLDCPVGGTPDMAENRDAEILVSGDKSSIDDCKEILDSMAKNVVIVGGEPGKGKAMKLAVNSLIAMNRLALTE